MRGLAEFVKYNKVVYSIYYYVGSLLVNMMKLFVRSDRNTVLFVSYFKFYSRLIAKSI